MNSSVRKAATSLPGVVAALLPSVACPGCWPAYAGLLSSVGLGAFLNGPYLMTVIVGSLALSLSTLAYNARSRRGFGPVILGGVATTLIIVARLMEIPSMFQWIGATCLIVASAWNAWPVRQATNAKNCNACACVDNSPRSEG